MNQRRHLSIIAAVATLMAAAPLSILFKQWTWAIDSFIAVAAVCATGIGVRALRAPAWAQPLATSAALLLIITWLFPSGHEYAGLIPGGGTFTNFRDLISSAMTDMRELAIPVFDRKGLLFMTTAGVGLVAIVVDFVAVTLRRPAVAGLPMLAVYAVAVAISAQSVSVVPFIIGALGYLWLLATDSVDRVRMFGRRFTGDGRGVDMWEPSPLAAIGRRTAVIGVLLAVILPIGIPGLHHSLVGPIGPPVANGNGFGNCFGCAGTQVDLFATLSGQISESKPVVLATVRTNATKPPYLRFATADILNNHGFVASSPQGLPVSQGLPNPFTDGRGNPVGDIPATLHHADVQMGPLDSRFLPVFLEPRTGTLRLNNDSWRYDRDSQIIFSSTSSAQRLHYSFDFDQVNYPIEALRAAQKLPDNNPIQLNYTRVPSHPKIVDQVVATQTRGTTNEYDTVRALVDFFSPANHFVYSLSTKAGTTGSDIGDFLTNREGYCVQYAATLAWLVRAAGYPSRVAFGFTNGRLVQPGVYQMTNRDLHAWTEVYFDGLGWVPFDATPSANLTGAVHPAWDPDRYAPSGNSGGGQQPGNDVPTIGASGSASADNGAPRDFGGGGGVASGGGTGSHWFLWTLVALALVLVALLMPATARLLLRNRRAAADRRVSADSAAPGEPFVVVDADSTSSTTKQRVHAAWDELIDTMVDFRIRIDPTETPRAAIARLTGMLDLPPQAEAGAQMLGMAEERARYARRPGPSEPLHEAVRTIRRALTRRASFRTRFRATVMPPSVVARWSAAVTERIARFVAAAGAVRDMLLRGINVRRWMRRSPAR